MKIAVLSANLGEFDNVVENMEQNLPPNVSVKFHVFTDKDFPPIAGLTPRMQYRIPKLFGWEMFPGYDYYIWLDGSFTMQNPNSVKWFLDVGRNADFTVFRHPWRDTIREEVQHIEEYLLKQDKYIYPRYANGLHKEQYEEILKDKLFRDDNLYTSTAFMYRNNDFVQKMLKDWWFYQSRYFTVDQIVLPYLLYKHRLMVSVVEQNQYKIPYLTLTSHHK